MTLTYERRKLPFSSSEAGASAGVPTSWGAPNSGGVPDNWESLRRPEVEFPYPGTRIGELLYTAPNTCTAKSMLQHKHWHSFRWWIDPISQNSCFAILLELEFSLGWSSLKKCQATYCSGDSLHRSIGIGRPWLSYQSNANKLIYIASTFFAWLYTIFICNFVFNVTSRLIQSEQAQTFSSELLA